MHNKTAKHKSIQSSFAICINQKVKFLEHISRIQKFNKRSTRHQLQYSNLPCSFVQSIQDSDCIDQYSILYSPVSYQYHMTACIQSKYQSVIQPQLQVSALITTQLQYTIYLTQCLILTNVINSTSQIISKIYTRHTTIKRKTKKHNFKEPQSLPTFLLWQWRLILLSAFQNNIISLNDLTKILF